MSISSLNTLSTLAGPTAIPANATHLLVCLHGFGDEGQSYLNFAPVLNAILTQSPSPSNSKVILGLACPNGPQPTPMGQGYQWFADNNWTFRDRPGMARISQALWDYLQQLSSTHHIPLSRIALLGFSQGAMTALYAAPRWSEPIALVIAHSGCAVYQEELDGTTCQKPPVLFVHGQQDDMIPADQSLAAATGLDNLGFTTETHIIPGLAHGINAEALAHIATFLSSHFK